MLKLKLVGRTRRRQYAAARCGSPLALASAAEDRRVDLRDEVVRGGGMGASNVQAVGLHLMIRLRCFAHNLWKTISVSSGIE
eukprot:10115461-Heterocapsa_arctica.AAC.1